MALSQGRALKLADNQVEAGDVLHHRGYEHDLNREQIDPPERAAFDKLVEEMEIVVRLRRHPLRPQCFEQIDRAQHFPAAVVKLYDAHRHQPHRHIARRAVATGNIAGLDR